jgi:hypothetical protein
MKISSYFKHFNRILGSCNNKIKFTCPDAKTLKEFHCTDQLCANCTEATVGDLIDSSITCAVNNQKSAFFYRGFCVASSGDSTSSNLQLYFVISTLLVLFVIFV